MKRGTPRPGPIRLLGRLLPDDDWSTEFLDELADTASSQPAGARRAVWYVRQLFAPSTMALVYRLRRRERARRVSHGEVGMIGNIGVDLRHAVRTATREPGTSIFIALTLALGIGSVSAMYGVADRLFLSGPDGVEQHRDLFRLYLAVPNEAVGERITPYIPFATVSALQAEAPGLDASAVYGLRDALARLGAHVQPVRVTHTDGAYFRVLGVRPATGRFYDDEADGAAPAVLSHALATAAFGEAANAVGRTVELDGADRRIVGVAPAGFSGPHRQGVDVWIPFDRDRAHTRNWFMLGRLADFEAGSDRVQAVATAAQATHDRTDPGRSFQWAVGARIELAPISWDDGGQPPIEGSVARLLVAVMVLLLLIACGNVVNLLLARLTRREGEVHVRLALGSGRGRLVRLLVAESLTLSLAGAILSLPIAWIGGSLLREVLLPDMVWDGSPVDTRVLGITFGVALLIGLILGLLPARHAYSTSVTAGLRSRGVSDGRGGGRVRTALASAQVGLSAALLLCAGLFVQSFLAIRTTDLGMDADGVYRIGLLALDADAVSDGSDGEERAYARALDVARDLPDVEGAALTVGLPFHATFGMSVWVPGLDSVPRLPGGGPYVSAVGDGYFETVGTSIVRGSGIGPDDIDRQTRVVVVSRVTAARLWPDVDPLGRCVRIGAPDSECWTVVGVAEDVHQSSYREDRSLQFYVPLGSQRNFSGTALVVRPRSGSNRGVQTLRQRLAETDDVYDYVEVARLDAPLDPEIRPWRLGATVLAFASLLAATISLAGVYGVLSYSVSRRRRELGVRAALGASAGALRALVLRRGMLSGAVGIVLGFGTVVACSRWLTPLLFETPVLDPVVMALVGTGLMSASAAACIIPSARASGVEPVECLRAEE